MCVLAFVILSSYMYGFDLLFINKETIDGEVHLWCGLGFLQNILRGVREGGMPSESRHQLFEEFLFIYQLGDT